MVEDDQISNASSSSPLFEEQKLTPKSNKSRLSRLLTPNILPSSLAAAGPAFSFQWLSRKFRAFRNKMKNQGKSSTPVEQSNSSPVPSTSTISSLSIPDMMESPQIQNPVPIVPPPSPIMDENDQISNVSLSTASISSLDEVEIIMDRDDQISNASALAYPSIPPWMSLDVSEVIIDRNDQISNASISTFSTASVDSFYDEFENVFIPIPGSLRQSSMLKVYDLSDDPDRKLFFNQLFELQEKRDTPLFRCPCINKQPLDLYRIYMLVKERGGFVEVMNGEMWKEIAGLIGASTSAAYVLRLLYTKHLLPFECKYDRGDIDPEHLKKNLKSNSRKKSAENNKYRKGRMTFNRHLVSPSASYRRINIDLHAPPPSPDRTASPDLALYHRDQESHNSERHPSMMDINSEQREIGGNLFKIEHKSPDSAEITWTIPGVLALPDYRVKAPIFHLAGATWELAMYPNSFLHPHYYMDLGITKCNSRTQVHYMTCKFYIKTRNGVMIKRRSASRWFFNTSTSEWTIEKYLKRSWLRKMIDIDIIQPNNLTLVCQLQVKLIENTSSVVALPVSKTLRDFKDLFLNQEQCDVLIKVKGKEFQAHKAILIARSPVFACTFRNDMEEKATGILNIEDCDPSTFSDFLCFLYCGNADSLTEENVFSLFTVADKYDVQDLRSECLEFMKKNLSVNIFCNTATLAYQHSEKDLTELVTNFFINHFQEIIVKCQMAVFL